MGFWSGFEGLTGHRPGAFKGFKLKDIIDDDMWKRHERLNQGRRLEETGIPDTTMVYRGRGKPGAFGPVVGQQRQAQATPQVIPQSNRARFDAITLANQQRRNALWGSGPDNVTTRALQFPNIQSQMLIDPRISSGPGFTGEAEKTTVKKIIDDPNTPNTVTETIKEKVPSSIMNLVNQTYPQLNRTNQSAGYQTWPRHSGNAPGGFEGLLSKVLGWEGFNPASWAELARKRYEEDMRRRAAWQLKPSGSLTDRQMRY